MGEMSINITRPDWDKPHLCRDCHHFTAEGWQELKYSTGGPYLEKRCDPCAEVHYGDALPELVNDIPKKKRRSGQTEKTIQSIDSSPLLLGLTG